MTIKQNRVDEKVFLVARETIRAITACEVDGVRHYLGEHRDFRRHEELQRFIPEWGRFSFSWVRLRDGEVLDNHQHPTRSMILVCRGSVYVTGEAEQLLGEGDAVCVPPGRLHGFRTEPGQLFHGLSIQFEGKGLYEDEFAPRVRFDEAACANSVQDLQALNLQLLEQHGRNGLFQLFASGALQHDAHRRRRFLEALYVWSGYFQKMIYARQAMCTNPALLPVYAGHLSEEFGHDDLLKSEYGLDGTAYDAMLEAASQWFVMRMLSADEAQKIVIVHMVVESSGQLFGERTKDIIARPQARDTSYFELHAQADEDHSEIGVPYLQGLASGEFARLMETCRHAWDQMNLVHERIAAFAMAGSTSGNGTTNPV